MGANVIERVLINREQIAKRVEDIARRVNRDYSGKPLTMVCVLRGAAVFAADLLRLLTVDVEIDFIVVSSYGSSAESSGKVRLYKDLSEPVRGKNVLIVEDIIDTGATLKCVKDLFVSRGASVRICALLDKPSRRVTNVNADYSGFIVDNDFVVGYGLDYNQKFRNLPDICVLSPEVYNG